MRFELALLLSDRRAVLAIEQLLADGIDPAVALAAYHFSLEQPELDDWGRSLHDDVEVEDPDLPLG